MINSKLSFNTLVNIFTLVVGVSLIWLFIYKNYLEKNPTEAQYLHRGDILAGLENIDYSKSPNTILLALSTKCPYCTKNIPFYKTLIERSKDSQNIRIIALFPEKQSEVNQYLTEHKITLESISEVDYSKSNIASTPTIIWLNNEKTILNTWEGAFGDKEEKEFLFYYEKKKQPL